MTRSPFLTAVAVLALIMAAPISSALAQDSTADTEAVALPEGNADRGRRVFARCMACHTLGEGGPHRVGPNLWGVMDAPAGTRDGFRYSPVMTKAGEDGLVWNDAELDAYLAAPTRYMPGNRMSFVGLRRPQERADVIAYLRANAMPTPDAEAPGEE